MPSRRIAVRTNPRGYRRGEIPHRPSLSTDLLAPVHAGRVAEFSVHVVDPYGLGVAPTVPLSLQAALKE
jgi:hypothetical protein